MVKHLNPLEKLELVILIKEVFTIFSQNKCLGITSISWFEDNVRFATSACDKTVRIWNKSTKDCFK